MGSELRYVFDSNVIVSAALLPASGSRRALQAAKRIGTLFLSGSIVAELHTVLHRKRFDRYTDLEERMAFLAELIQTCVPREPRERFHACRDPDDDKFLELAIEVAASCLVSGDDDLRSLHPFRGIPILSPGEFLREVEDA